MTSAVATTPPKKVRTFYVYEHVRSDTGACFYVGKGSGNRAYDMRVRNRRHKFVQAKLSQDGLAVEVRLIAEGLAEPSAFDLERQRIAICRAAGLWLANVTDGGEGASGYKQTPEAIARTAAAHRGRKRSAETCARISAAAKGRKVDPARIERMAEINRGKKRPPFSAEHRARMAAASRGRTMSMETRAKLLAANLGRHFKHTEAAKAKIAAAATGKKRAPLSEAHRAAIAAGNRGKVFSPEHRARIAAARTAHEARKRAP